MYEGKQRMVKLGYNIGVNSLCLLITGCINPNREQGYLYLKDTEERLRQYIDSILYYIRYSTFHKIVYCDNSNYQYDKLEQLYFECKKFDKKFEWLSFCGDSDKVVVCGKGYGEGEIIQYAIENSNLLSQSTAFFKVTGRLKVLNINDLAGRIKADNTYFNRDIYSGRRALDTRVYSVNINFYKEYLLNAYHECDIEKRSLENVFWLSLDKKYRNLPVFPVVEGISGGNGRNYMNESKSKIWFFSVLCKFNIFNYK